MPALERDRALSAPFNPCTLTQGRQAMSTIQATMKAVISPKVTKRAYLGHQKSGNLSLLRLVVCFLTLTSSREKRSLRKRKRQHDPSAHDPSARSVDRRHWSVNPKNAGNWTSDERNRNRTQKLQLLRAGRQKTNQSRLQFFAPTSAGMFGEQDTTPLISIHIPKLTHTKCSHHRNGKLKCRFYH